MMGGEGGRGSTENYKDSWKEELVNLCSMSRKMKEDDITRLGLQREL
jgi:hypothetical protein